MADYSGDIAAAREMIEESGAAVLFTREGTGDVDPLSDTRDVAAPLTASSFAVKIPPGVLDKVATTRQEREGGRFLVAALGMSLFPKNGDLMDFAGERWFVLSCDPLNPNGTPIIFTVDAER
jgi:hypothetical protein